MPSGNIRNDGFIEEGVVLLEESEALPLFAYIGPQVGWEVSGVEIEMVLQPGIPLMKVVNPFLRERA